MRLTYKAVTKEGEVVQGLIEAKNINDAARHLRSRDFMPINITSKETDLLRFLPFNRFSGSNLIFFTRQLASMLSSGLTLMQALSIMKEQVSSPVVKDVVSGIIVDIEEGKSLSLALEKYPRVFSQIYVSLVKAGEASGLLDKVMSRLAENLEKQQELKSTIKSALIYPVIVILGIIGVMFIMMIFVIPQLSIMYSGMNIEMPFSTRVVIGVSDFTKKFWPFIFGIVILFFVLMGRWYKTETGKLAIDAIILKIPIFGKLIKQSILTEFTRTLGLLVGSGTLVIEALMKTSEITGNVLYQSAIKDVAKKVEKGISVGDAMSFYSLFPPLLIQMAKIGEQTGKLDDSLGKVSQYYERETEQTVKNLTTLMEPIIMVILGLGVGFMLLAVITPIYKLTSSL